MTAMVDVYGFLSPTKLMRKADCLSKVFKTTAPTEYDKSPEIGDGGVPPGEKLRYKNKNNS